MRAKNGAFPIFPATPRISHYPLPLKEVIPREWTEKLDVRFQITKTYFIFLTIFNTSQTKSLHLDSISGRTAVKNNYLCTYDLYGPVRNCFDAGKYIMWGCGGRGVGAGNLEFLGPLK